MLPSTVASGAGRALLGKRWAVPPRADGPGHGVRLLLGVGRPRRPGYQLSQ